ncbi:thermonuclease family protein [Deinococcus peraridilitoris]|uniref:Micrococcal nuclease-like nuclease n=1 Tax=Deinococcus peraridilitoris (strain DSM 19664 / LMG 22246 / CIP 109416 / KR-200) TaxID=937777 RepID=L0A1T6_DEIPD|nr:thermonuclease family protein [Deinococcus peraridilitoris]AFZ67107.1 micrococcal nuclease-like nuclease [Deinococcus peraridilitoris DSM 19664]
MTAPNITAEFLYRYRATCVRVVDGGTVILKVSLGFFASLDIRARLYGINAPELRGATYEMGRVSRDYLRGLLFEGDKPRELLIRTHKDNTDKYGRTIAEIAVVTSKGLLDVNASMVEQGFALRVVS